MVKINYGVDAWGDPCPVCGYRMDEPAANYNICPSCGTEFGISDVYATEAELREAWIEDGPNWWSTVDPEPMGWNAWQQLKDARLLTWQDNVQAIPTEHESIWAAGEREFEVCVA